MLNRRNFLYTTGVLSTSGLCPVSLQRIGNSEPQTNLTILKARPYLQAEGKGKINIRWITNFPCYSWVEYGNNAEILDKKAETVCDGLVDAYQQIHTVTIKNLSSAKSYYYRINSQVIEKFDPYNIVFGETFSSKVYVLKTIDKKNENISFLIFNDIHDRPESFAHLLQYRQSGKNDFILLNGDMFNYIDEEDQIVQNLLSPLSNIFPEINLVFSRGNHETRGKFARHLPSYFSKKKKGFYHSFTAGPVFCIVLDSGEDKPDDDKEYFGLVKFDSYREKQTEWLKKEVQTEAFKKAKYRIVFSHIPPFYSGEWHGTMHCRELWNGIFNEAKIDLLIAGHTHKYGIHSPVNGQHNYPIVIGGGPKDGARTIIEVNVNKHALHLTITGDDGQIKKELTL